LTIVLLVDCATAFESQLSKPTEFDPELVRFSLVISELDNTKLLALIGIVTTFFGLQSFDTIQSSYQTNHVVLEELH
jgi:hypothetical protein